VSTPLALAFLILALPQSGPPEAAPAKGRGTDAPAEHLPGFVAALEVSQGEKSERVALFDDGTIAQAVRTGEAPIVVKRKRISPEERAVLSKVISEALTSGEGPKGNPTLLTDRSRRKIVIEIARPDGGSVRFEFDDLSPLSLGLGRARGALEDLSDRFQEPRASEKEVTWDAATAKERDRLRRRKDGKFFRIVRDDTMSPYIELEEDGRRLERLKMPRRELPKFFEEPVRDQPDEPR
jgi:hypothetical protein